MKLRDIQQRLSGIDFHNNSEMGDDNDNDNVKKGEQEEEEGDQNENKNEKGDDNDYEAHSPHALSEQCQNSQ